MTHVREPAFDGGRGRRRRPRRMRAAAAALAPLEIAIARRCAPLTLAEDAVVHAEAHRAARLAPFEAGLCEDPIEAFALGVRLDLLRSRHDQRAHPAVHLVA